MKLTARDKILAAIKQGKPALQVLPVSDHINAVKYDDVTAKFIETFSGIGGQVIVVNSLQDVETFIRGNYAATNIVTTIAPLKSLQQVNNSSDAHDYENIELAVLPAQFGVAENGAVWLTENDMQVRVLPFICRQLAVVLNKTTIISNMHDAYDRIADSSYDFAAFIAGPSKTADIEQSLVLGAHGPKGMIIFLLDQ